MKRSIRVLLTVLLGICISKTSAADPLPQVVVRVTDGYGNPVHARKITMTANGVVKPVLQDQFFGTEHGQYKLEVSAAGFSAASQTIVIDQPAQVISVAMKLGVMEAPTPRCSVLGRVSPGTAAARIRLMQMFGPYAADVPIRSAGSFEFQGLECGDYMLIVMGTRECLGTKIVRAAAAPVRYEFDISAVTGDACNSLKER